jgi:hypothetical protein
LKIILYNCLQSLALLVFAKLALLRGLGLKFYLRGIWGWIIEEVDEKGPYTPSQKPTKTFT